MSRNLEERTGPSAWDMSFTVTNGLNFRVALGSYRIFYTGGSEDFFFRHRRPDEVAEMDAQEEAFIAGAGSRLDEWVNKTIADENDALDEAAAEDGAEVAAEAAAVAAI